MKTNPLNFTTFGTSIQSCQDFTEDRIYFALVVLISDLQSYNLCLSNHISGMIQSYIYKFVLIKNNCENVVLWENFEGHPLVINSLDSSIGATQPAFFRLLIVKEYKWLTIRIYNLYFRHQSVMGILSYMVM